MTTRLDIYNGALRILGERRLASVTENREPRRLLDDVWDADAIKTCLEQGQWKFAIRTVEITYTPSIEPDFGYQRAFTKPTDLVRVVGLSAEPYFNNPLTRYVDEAGYWFSDYDTLYVRYVSDDDEYGRDLSLWPESFTKYVEYYMASEILPNLTASQAKEERVSRDMKKALVEARSRDAMAGPTQYLPLGGWSRALMAGGWRSREDG